MAASARAGRRTGSPAPAGEGEARMAGEDHHAPRSLRTVFQRKSPEEQARRRTMLADLVRDATSEQEDGKPWFGTPSSPSPSPQLQGVRPSSPGGSNSGVGAALRRGSQIDGPLRFSSYFECGNLLTAKLVCSQGGKSGGSSSSTSAPGPHASEVEYELHVDSDTQSAQGHTQWFYFCVRNNEFCGTVHFRIVNLRKKKSLYQQGLQPYVFSAKGKARGWDHFCCQCVSYSSNGGHSKQKGDKTEGSGGKSDLNTLAWSYRVEKKYDELYFASYPPYSYSMLNNFLCDLHCDPDASPHFLRSELCRSIGQLPVPLLVIGEDVASTEDPAISTTPDIKEEPQEQPPKSRAKMAIVITARQHPGEVVGSWAVQGLLKFLLGPSPAARTLRETYVFHVVPMVNVDGVVHGNSRCTLAGVDPNRVWHDPNPILHPVIFALKNHLRSLTQGLLPPSAAGPVKGIEMFLDLHGHSAKFGCFFYGSNPAAHISNAVFPKLCSLISTDLSFEQCHWRCPRSHRKTARYVVFKQFGVKYAYTMECSLYAPVPHPAASDGTCLSSRNGHFTPARVEFVGCTAGVAAAIFLCVDVQAVCSLCSSSRSIVEDRQGDQAGDEDCTSISTDTGKQEFMCTCNDNFLLELSCPSVFATRPWMSVQAIKGLTAAEVLGDLAATYGDVVPDLSRWARDGSDDGGDSDGDDALDPQEAEEASRAKGSKESPGASPQSNQSAAPTSSPPSKQSVRKSGSGKEANGHSQRRPLLSGKAAPGAVSGSSPRVGASASPEAATRDCRAEAASGPASSSEHFQSFDASSAAKGSIAFVSTSSTASQATSSRQSRAASNPGSRARSVDNNKVDKAAFDPLTAAAQPLHIMSSRLPWQAGRPDSRMSTRGAAYLWVDETPEASQHEEPGAEGEKAMPPGVEKRRISSSDITAWGSSAQHRSPDEGAVGAIAGQGHLASLCGTGAGTGAATQLQLCVGSGTGHSGDASNMQRSSRTPAPATSTGKAQRTSSESHGQPGGLKQSSRGRASTERGDRTVQLRSSATAGGVRRGTPPTLDDAMPMPAVFSRPLVSSRRTSVGGSDSTNGKRGSTAGGAHF
eukprot:TRINITY_DN105711_c0_g1_i1.p1 TRINITY_DN105711_c0_g1~~TRINITY_DN105711_c0_g1_i1.p1  ORF type:complete len:1090 (-),score=156.22 TRINITY_DN105711_c0_g1_i1:40-3309(-)